MTLRTLYGPPSQEVTPRHGEDRTTVHFTPHPGSSHPDDSGPLATREQPHHWTQEPLAQLKPSPQGHP